MIHDEGRAHLVERMHAVAAGDRTALRDVYRLTSAKLFGTILRILPDREEAEDVLQEVYLTVWNKAERFDAARASPVTWLTVIARNRAIDRLRTLRPQNSKRQLEAASEIEDDAPSPLAALQNDDEARQLVRCLNALDERSRGAIVAAFYDGRTYENLAADAGMSLSAMKSAMRRTLQRLRRCLDA